MEVLRVEQSADRLAVLYTVLVTAKMHNADLAAGLAFVFEPLACRRLHRRGGPGPSPRSVTQGEPTRRLTSRGDGTASEARARGALQPRLEDRRTDSDGDESA